MFLREISGEFEEKYLHMTGATFAIRPVDHKGITCSRRARSATKTRRINYPSYMNFQLCRSVRRNSKLYNRRTFDSQTFQFSSVREADFQRSRVEIRGCVEMETEQTPHPV